MRRKIGFLFQNAALFDSISVGENVAFPLRRHTRLPDGEIRERGAAEARRGRARARSTTRCRPSSRAACASAPAWRARWRSIRRILLVDEPSAGLDPITADEIDELLLDLKQQRRHHAHRRHPQHSERAAARRRAGDAARGADRWRRARPAELERSDDELVRAFMSVAARRLSMMAKSRLAAVGAFVARRHPALRRRAVPDRQPPHAVQRHVRGLRRVHADCRARQRRQGAGRRAWTPAKSKRFACRPRRRAGSGSGCASAATCIR